MTSSAENSPLKRIAVFYDGTFYSKVSAYYRHVHPRQSHLSFQGIHEFVRRKVEESRWEGASLCRIVESHFFRGRFSLSSAKTANSLASDRFLDQLLMNAGVVTHYYPMNESVTPPEEKAIDVWLALEAFDLAINRRLDVLALFVGDEDFVPLIRKLMAIGTRVLVLAFDINWTDQFGRVRALHTSQHLLEEAAYSISLNEEIDSRTRDYGLTDRLFALEPSERFEQNSPLRGMEPLKFPDD
jgi:uncharacterized LabA/DUF88 family protein